MIEVYINIEQCRYNINVLILFEMELYQCGAIFYLCSFNIQSDTCIMGIHRN